MLDIQKGVMRVDYAKVWEKIITRQPVRSNSIPGAFAKWDNTPRRGDKGVVYENNTPDLFEYYLEKQIKRCRNVYNNDMIFIYAWNEWAEGEILSRMKNTNILI